VGAEVIAAFQDVESGRKVDRTGLAAALALCRVRRANLLIAKLDRLARSVAFISNLMKGGVNFVAADMSSVNRLTVHVLAAVAEHEREMISQRTKAALAAAKVRGTRLGNPRVPPTGALAVESEPSTPGGMARAALAQARAVAAYGAVIEGGPGGWGMLARRLRPSATVSAASGAPGRGPLVAAVCGPCAALLRRGEEFHYDHPCR